MAKAQALDWNAWRNGEVRAKGSVSKLIEQHDMQERIKRIQLTSAQLRKLATTGFIILGGITLLVHGFTPDVLAAAGAPEAVQAMAQVTSTADFAEELRKATKPIRDIIFAFGHEIYFVMMAWGGLEALIGKTQQGFQRMKASTAAYIVLYWIPWIVRTVNSAVPKY